MNFSNIFSIFKVGRNIAIELNFGSDYAKMIALFISRLKNILFIEISEKFDFREIRETFLVPKPDKISTLLTFC